MIDHLAKEVLALQHNIKEAESAIPQSSKRDKVLKEWKKEIEALHKRIGEALDGPRKGWTKAGRAYVSSKIGGDQC